MRRFRAPSSGLDKFFAAPFSVGYITSMSGFDLRQAQLQHCARIRYEVERPAVVRHHRHCHRRPGPDRPLATATATIFGFSSKVKAGLDGARSTIIDGARFCLAIYLLF